MKIQKSLFVVMLFAILVMSIGVAAAQDPVTIEWWHISTGDPGLTYWQTLADEYVAANPHVTINITVLANEDFKARLVTVMQGNDPPDLFQSWGGGVLWAFADAGLVRDISPELDGEWYDSFAVPAAVNLYGKDGAYYGVPWDWGAVGMFYNKALFTQAGLDPENPPATWTDFLAAVQTLKEAGITPISLGELEKWPGHFWYGYTAVREGGEAAFLAAYDRSGSFADEAFVRAGERVLELNALEPFQDGFMGLTHNDQQAAFGNGEAAMMLQGQWAVNAQREQSASGEGIGEDMGWFPFPAIEGGAGDPTDTFGGGNGIAVGANAPDEAVDFLKFLTSAENQRRGAELGALLPVVTGLDDLYADDPVFSSIITARNNAAYFQLYYDQFMPPAVGEAINDAVETLFAGVATAEEAAAAIEETASFELQ
jgi:raffinose/stachyose/melibiose transport system substrate-binding protein